jgi:hypothetical protein
MNPSNQNTNTPKTKPYFVEVQHTFSQFLMIETLSKEDAINLALKDDGDGSGAVEHIPQVVDVREISKDEFMQHIMDTFDRLVKAGKLAPPVRGL